MKPPALARAWRLPKLGFRGLTASTTAAHSPWVDGRRSDAVGEAG